MTQLALYSKGVHSICPVDRGIDLDSQGGESKNIVVISNIFLKLFRFYVDIPLLWLVPSSKDCSGSGGSDIAGHEIFPLLQHMPNFGDLTELFVSRSSIQ